MSNSCKAYEFTWLIAVHFVPSVGEEDDEEEPLGHLLDEDDEDEEGQEGHLLHAGHLTGLIVSGHAAVVTDSGATTKTLDSSHMGHGGGFGHIVVACSVSLILLAFDWNEGELLEVSWKLFKLKLGFGTKYSPWCNPTKKPTYEEMATAIMSTNTEVQEISRIFDDFPGAIFFGWSAGSANQNSSISGFLLAIFVH
jgi:hypothetical protein